MIGYTDDKYGSCLALYVECSVTVNAQQMGLDTVLTRYDVVLPFDDQENTLGHGGLDAYTLCVDVEVVQGQGILGDVVCCGPTVTVGQDVIFACDLSTSDPQVQDLFRYSVCEFHIRFGIGHGSLVLSGFEGRETGQHATGHFDRGGNAIRIAVGIAVVIAFMIHYKVEFLERIACNIFGNDVVR